MRYRRPMLRQSGCITTTLLVSLLAQQAPPTIRSRTTLVPIDVRVVDASANPITDLKRDDFVIEEDGVRQDIKLFETRTLTAEPPSAETAASALLPLRRDLAPGAPSGAANQRVFLIALKFVKVIAYDYASDLTGSALVTIALK